MGICELAAIRRVEGPAGIDASAENCIEFEKPAQHQKVPTQQIQSRKGQVSSPNHHRYKKISEHGRDGGDEKEPDHDDAVHRKKLVVRFGCEQVGLRRHQFQTDQGCKRATDKEEERHSKQEQQRDALVITREEPGLPPKPGCEVILVFNCSRHFCLVHCRGGL